MDLPESDDHQEFIDKKNQALMHLKIDDPQWTSPLIKGQYFEELSEEIQSYRDEKNIDPQSHTETFVAGHLKAINRVG